MRDEESTRYTRWDMAHMGWWCDVCQQHDDEEHAILVERVIGQKEPVGVFCEWSGKWLDAESPNGISASDLEYVKKSLGVV